MSQENVRDPTALYEHGRESGPIRHSRPTSTRLPMPLRGRSTAWIPGRVRGASWLDRTSCWRPRTTGDAPGSVGLANPKPSKPPGCGSRALTSPLQSHWASLVAGNRVPRTRQAGLKPQRRGRDSSQVPGFAGRAPVSHEGGADHRTSCNGGRPGIDSTVLFRWNCAGAQGFCVETTNPDGRTCPELGRRRCRTRLATERRRLLQDRLGTGRRSRSKTSSGTILGPFRAGRRSNTPRLRAGRQHEEDRQHDRRGRSGQVAHDRHLEMLSCSGRQLQ